MTNIGAVAARSWTAAVDRCPKHMAHGPCAGVRADGGCEVAVSSRCSYLDVARADYPYPGVLAPSRPRVRSEVAAEFLATAATRPVVVIDVVAPPLSAAGLRSAAAELAPVADACLLGDHGGARVQLPPAYRARLLAEEGARAWVGLNCRDRNRVAIEGEIAASVDAGAVGVHCITGDHTVCGDRPDAAPVFDLDCVGVVDRVRETGLLCSVAHAPAARPTDRRLSRLLAKIDAGADVVFVDHCGGPAQIGQSVAALRAAGFAGIVLACVPVVTSMTTAAVIESFAADRLPAGYVERILAAPDIRVQGIASATGLADAMLRVPGVDGVNLSGGALPGDEFAAARDLAEVGRRVLGLTVGPVR